MYFKFGILFLLISTQALALKLPTNLTDIKDNEIKFLDNSYDFEGIVKLNNCSGALVKFSGQSDLDNAIVMTNGHCLNRSNFLKPGEVVSQQPKKRKMRIFDKNMKLVNVESTKILYATMTNTDVAYYELKQTYKDIEAFGIRPYLMDSAHPILGMNIDIVSGYWERGYRCHIDGFIFHLLEGDWTFTDAIRYSSTGCETIGGTSGSPIIQTDTRVVVGVNNTGNKDGGRCQINNPCERDENGDITVFKRSYGQQTYNVYTCLTPDFKIDLTKPECELPK